MVQGGAFVLRHVAKGRCSTIEMVILVVPLWSKPLVQLLVTLSAVKGGLVDGLGFDVVLTSSLLTMRVKRRKLTNLAFVSPGVFCVHLPSYLKRLHHVVDE